jgi:predicted outer membrane repeat protein
MAAKNPRSKFVTSIPTICGALLLIGCTIFPGSPEGCAALPPEFGGPQQSDRPFGLILLPPDTFANLPQVAPPLGARLLPGKVDLRSVAPSPGDQGQSWACVSWAISYMLTIQEVRANGGDPNDPNVQFSPAFVYNQTKESDCLGGSRAANALNLILDRGCCTLSLMPYVDLECESPPSQEAIDQAAGFKAPGWGAINQLNLADVKGYLASGNPVLAGIRIFAPFPDLQGPDATFSVAEGDSLGGHALLVIGFDDDRQAFLVINSWGTGWGDGGYAWISYDVWPNIAREGYIATARQSAGGITATAQPDRTVTDEDRNGSAEVTLVAEGDGGPGRTAVTHVWSEAGAEIARGREANVTLSVGVHAIQLAVTFNDATTITTNINVTVNAAPAAIDDAVSVQEDSNGNILDVLANDTDAEGQDLAIRSIEGATEGAIVAITDGGATISYDPPPNFAGEDSFRYTIEDTLGGRDEATVSITIENVNDVPIAVDDNATVGESSDGNQIDVLANDSDPDGDALTITAVTRDPVHGTVVISADGGSLTYDPNEEYTGPDDCDYALQDPSGSEATATVTINVVGSVIYVNQVLGDDENNGGTAWNDAFRSLQKALDEARDSNGFVTDIWMADGTYTPTIRTDDSDPRSATFRLLNGVTLWGGFVGGEQDIAQRNPFVSATTILSGDLDGDGNEGEISDDNAYHVLTTGGLNDTAGLDGFEINGGIANGTAPENRNGAGIYNISGSPFIRNCVFIENFAVDQGGAIYNENCLESGGPQFYDSWFTQNSAGGGGGAIYNTASCPTIVNCTFSGNNSGPSDGGAILNSGTGASIINCFFISNDGGTNGGAVHNLESNPEFINCAFVGNNAVFGGGMSIFGQDDTPELINCTFAGNNASQGGGGGEGGGIYNLGSTPNVTNCIFWENTNGQDITESAQIFVESGTVTINYSCIQGLTGALGGTGNIDQDPMFLDSPPAENGNAEDVDLRMSAGSLCIDAGNNTVVPPDNTDLDGDSLFDEEPISLDLGLAPRFADDPATADTGAGSPPVVDMGAYEFQPN